MNKTDVLNPLEAKLGFIEKYGYKGVLILGLSLAAPYAGSLFDSYNNNVIKAAVHEQISPVMFHIRNIEKILDNTRSGVVTLDAKEIDYIARMALKAQSIQEITELRSIIHNLPTKLTDRVTSRIHKKIKLVIVSNNKLCYSRLNYFQNINIGKLGDHISKTFPLELLIDDVTNIVLNSNASDRVSIENDVLAYMLDVQNTYFTDMYNKILKNTRI
jgi:hypothetical protein